MTFQGYEAGAVDFLYKPVRPAIVRSKVQVFYELHMKQVESLNHLAALEEANARFSEELRERKRMETVVQESEVRYRSLLELSPVSIIVETNGRMSYINTAVLKLLGEDDREKVSQHSMIDYVQEKYKESTRKAMERIVSQGGRAEPFETELIRSDGSRADVEVYSACILYEGEVGVQMALQDITERKLLEAEWRRLSRMDGLTGIYNRRAFDEILMRELRRAQRNHTSLALIMVDIDAFKLYNDHYGHQKGDESLKTVATVLQEGAVRGGDHVARYGGEEFAIIMADTDTEGACQVAETLRQSIEVLAIPHSQSPTADHVTISMGGLRPRAGPPHHARRPDSPCGCESLPCKTQRAQPGRALRSQCPQRLGRLSLGIQPRTNPRVSAPNWRKWCSRCTMCKLAQPIEPMSPKNGWAGGVKPGFQSAFRNSFNSAMSSSTVAEGAAVSYMAGPFCPLGIFMRPLRIRGATNRPKNPPSFGVSFSLPSE